MDLKLAVERLEDGFKREAKAASEGAAHTDLERLVQHEVKIASQLAHRAIEIALLGVESAELRDIRAMAADLLDEDEIVWRELCGDMLRQHGRDQDDFVSDIVGDVLNIARDMIKHLKIKIAVTPERKKEDNVTVPSGLLHRPAPDDDGLGMSV